MNAQTFAGGRSRRYLLIEDDPAHAELVRMAFALNESDWTMDHVDNGEKGLSFVRREGEYTQAPRPDVILLDLKLPKLDGHQVLASLKSDPRTATIPVIMLTTSADDQDKRLAYELHANSYVVKPMDGNELHEMIKGLDEYWARWHESCPVGLS